MKAAKIRNNTKKEEIKNTNQEYSLKKMIITTVILLVIFFMFYFITTLVVKPVEQQKIDTPVILDSSKITISNLLNRKDSEYYVLATKNSLYSSSTSYSQIYNSYISDYSSDENALPFYNVDLDDALNKNYFSETLNITENLEELKLNNEVLFKIKDGKIDQYYVGNSSIVEALSKL